MKASKRTVGAFRSSPYSLLSSCPITACDFTTKLVLRKVWSERNNYSYKQTSNLIRKKLLIAKKYKGRWYIASIGNLNLD